MVPAKVQGKVETGWHVHGARAGEICILRFCVSAKLPSFFDLFIFYLVVSDALTIDTVLGFRGGSFVAYIRIEALQIVVVTVYFGVQVCRSCLSPCAFW